jgi:hypothetical protein
LIFFKNQTAGVEAFPGNAGKSFPTASGFWRLCRQKPASFKFH